MKTWQEKMNDVIGEVLGEGYNIKIITDTEFEVYFVDAIVLKTETVYSLPNHWRKLVKDTIILIIEKMIQTSLSKT